MDKPRAKASISAGMAVTVILLLAAVLRVYDLPQAELSHFDEGAYAQSARYLNAGDGFYYGQEYHAPPGYPILVSMAYRLLGGPSATAAFLVSAVAGIGTCWILFALGRHLFGTGVGLVACGLLAVNDFHVAICKSALVDAQFTLCFAAALGLLYMAWTRNRVGWAIAAGLAVGAAWNTKYNGFLPLAIALTAILLESLRSRWLSNDAPSPPLLRSLGLWLLSAGIAAACYLPWAMHVHRTLGGYQHLTEHQSKFLQDWTNWLGHAQELLASLAVFRHVGAAVVVAALIGGVVMAFKSQRGHRLWLWLSGVVALCAIVYAGVESVYLAAALCGVIYAVRRGNRADRFVAVWVVTLIILTPLYRPYVRLVLPLLPAVILLAVRWADLTLTACRGAARGRARLELGLGLVIVVAIAAVGGKLLGIPLGPWQSTFADRGGYADAARELRRIKEDNAVVAFHAQPPFHFYSPSAKRTGDDNFVAPLVTFARQQGIPAYLVVDFILTNNEQARRSVADHAAQLELVATVKNNLGILQLLDQYGAAGFWSDMREPESDAAINLRSIYIYRVRQTLAK